MQKFSIGDIVYDINISQLNVINISRGIVTNTDYTISVDFNFNKCIRTYQLDDNYFIWDKFTIAENQLDNNIKKEKLNRNLYSGSYNKELSALYKKEDINISLIHKLLLKNIDKRNNIINYIINKTPVDPTNNEKLIICNNWGHILDAPVKYKTEKSNKLWDYNVWDGLWYSNGRQYKYCHEINKLIENKKYFYKKKFNKIKTYLIKFFKTYKENKNLIKPLLMSINLIDIKPMDKPTGIINYLNIKHAKS